MDLTVPPTRAEVIAGWRDLIDFLDGHPAVPLPFNPALWAWAADDTVAVQALTEWTADIAGELDVFEPWGDHHRRVTRRFGALPVELLVTAPVLDTVESQRTGRPRREYVSVGGLPVEADRVERHGPFGLAETHPGHWDVWCWNCLALFVDLYDDEQAARAWILANIEGVPGHSCERHTDDERARHAVERAEADRDAARARDAA